MTRDDFRERSRHIDSLGVDLQRRLDGAQVGRGAHFGQTATSTVSLDKLGKRSCFGRGDYCCVEQSGIDLSFFGLSSTFLDGQIIVDGPFFVSAKNDRSSKRRVGLFRVRGLLCAFFSHIARGAGSSLGGRDDGDGGGGDV